MNEQDRPLTRGDLQTILNAIRNTDNKIDRIQDSLSQVKRDVNTIATNTGHTRDQKGQL